MVKTLSRIGNSLGLIIDRPVLDLLKVDESTPLEISTDGDVLTIRPLRSTHRARVTASAKRAMGAHRETLSKLAK
ncbi:MAG: AbrB/MazE/SpoVT family DNA-binding domain-containing protein [Polyangiales bacterium]